jgi:hypothetical protein
LQTAKGERGTRCLWRKDQFGAFRRSSALERFLCELDGPVKVGEVNRYFGEADLTIRRELRATTVNFAARPRQLLAMVLRQGTWVVSLGAVLGLGGAVIGGRLVRDLLYDTRTFEPTVVVSVTILLAVFAIVTMIAPALRAGRTDPAVTLRTE